MNLKKYFIFCSLLFTTHFVSSQEFTWGGKFGGIGEDVIKATHVDEQGNSYITGYFTETASFDFYGIYQLVSNGFYDAFVQKIDNNGNLLWAKSFGGGYFDHGSAITTDTLGNVYITGNYEETVNFDPNGSNFSLTSAGAQDVFILKLDSNGNFVWAKSIGGTGFEEALSIVYSPLGQIILSGFFYEPVDFDPSENEYLLTSEGQSDSFILRLNDNGDFISVQQYGGTGTDIAIDMKVNQAGDLFITGFFTGTADFDPSDTSEYNLTEDWSGVAGYVLHLNNAGAFVKAGMTHGGDVFNNGISVDDQNNIYVTGYFGYTVNFNHDSTGIPISFTSLTHHNGFVMKIDAFGNVSWVKRLECNDAILGYDIDVTSTGDVVSVGYFTNTADFDPSAEVFSLTQQSGNAYDAFISILDNDGNFKNAFQFGGVSFVDANNIGLDAQDNIYTAAHFENTVDINPMASSQLNVSALDFRDNYILKMNSESLSVSENEVLSIKVYPNPTSNYIILDGQGLEQGSNYKIFDIRGSLVSKGRIEGNNSIDVKDLIPGLYLLEVDHFGPVKVIIK